MDGLTAALRRSHAVIEFDLGGVILSANRNYCDMLGYAESEIVGRPHSMLCSPECVASDEYQAFWRRLAAGETEVGEFKHIAKDGAEVWVQATYSTVLDADGEPVGVAAFATDVTARKVEAAEHEGKIRAIDRSQAIIEFGVNGVILAANSNYCAMLGYAEDEIVGRHHSTFCDPDYAQSEDYKAFWGRLASGEFEAGEFKRIAKDGSEVWIQATYNPILDPDGEPIKIVKFATDVTERKARDAELVELSENAQRFAALSQAMDNWFWETDAEGRFIYMSENFQRIIGEDPAKYLGRRRTDFVARFDDDDEADKIADRVAKRLPFKDLQYQRRTTDGRSIWVRATGAPKFGPDGEFLGYRGASSDITGQMAMRERRDQFAKLIDQIPLGLMLVDKDMNISLLNRHMLGYLSETFDGIGIGSSYIDLIRQSVEKRDVDVNADESDEYIEKRVSAVTGAPTELERVRGARAVEIRSTPLEDGSILFFELDVSARRDLRNQLIHSQRLDAIGQITAGVAHDFNNLLAIILGNLELISEDLRDHESYEFVETALSATKRGAALTEQLLAFGRHATLTPKIANVDDVIYGVRDLLRQALPENINLDLRFSERKKFIDVDVRQLEQTLLNLVINARDAIEGTGSIVISTSHGQASVEGGSPDEPSAKVEDVIVISVGDDGHGIPAEEIDKVFEPFYTTKEVGRGSGLGLSMAHGFVSQSGGRITLDSAPEQGTTVSMYFPAKDRPETRMTEAPRTSVAHKVRGRPILLVEDNADVRRVMRAHLEGFGYKVVEASDGRAALRELNSNPAIEMMLTDFVMPGELQGGALIVEAKRLRPGLKAIMMTGYAEKTAFDVELADFEILLKPVSRADLQAALRRAEGLAEE